MTSRTTLSAPYRFTRSPLTVVDRRLVQRLPQDSRPRMVFDRVLGSMDALAGRLLSDDALADRGRARVSRIDKLSIAADLEQQAAERRAAANDVIARGKDEAADQAAEARDRAKAAQADAAKTERDAKQEASAQARRAAAAKKKQAEQRKQQRVATISRTLEKAEAGTTARTTAAQKTAKAKLDAAARTRAAAGEERRDADQLEKLATVKRAARKQD